MKLDTVLTVAIGRKTPPDNLNLSTKVWAEFGHEVFALLCEYGHPVAVANGIGEPSDINDEEEETKVFIVINLINLTGLRAKLAVILTKYGQQSAAFAYDPAHEPCFATVDGLRPFDACAT